MLLQRWIVFITTFTFTFEEEVKGTLPFLDVLSVERVTQLWQLYSVNPKIMQFTQIVTLLHQVLQKKLKYFEKVFHGFNNYREYVIKQILKQVQDE